VTFSYAGGLACKEVHRVQQYQQDTPLVYGIGASSCDTCTWLHEHGAQGACIYCVVASCVHAWCCNNMHGRVQGQFRLVLALGDITRSCGTPTINIEHHVSIICQHECTIAKVANQMIGLAPTMLDPYRSLSGQHECMIAKVANRMIGLAPTMLDPYRSVSTLPLNHWPVSTLSLEHRLVSTLISWY
jgi:hypothetical protein